MKIDKVLASKYPALLLVIINAIVYCFDWAKFNDASLIFGLIIAMFGIFTYAYNWFMMGNVWTITVEKKSKIITNGFFKYIRHPLYLGCVIACLGGVIVSFNIFLMLMLIFVDMPFVYLRAKYEEKLLIKSLKGYKEYMNSTWMFIPYVF
ncbi:MAG: isoprenylcysteine carboxylmethyltransferase family protein [Candidatus Nanoarchaeia archaeon]|jgi:protein-S-isoprenylcysteine O-methyltransferase Ste14